MHWYELAKIVHFMGIIALFGFFATFARSSARLRVATTVAGVRTWLGVLKAASGMLDGGAGLALVSGFAMVGLRWRGLTLKPGWVGSSATVLITAAIGATIGAATLGRQGAGLLQD